MFVTSEQPTEDAQPGPLVLSEIRPNIFLAVLEFIYTNCCSLSTDMVSSVSFASPELLRSLTLIGCVCVAIAVVMIVAGRFYAGN